MQKSVFTQEYGTLLRLLKETRRTANVTQVQLAEKLRQSQSFVSKYERGERRLDVIQLRTICQALGIPLADFIAELERRLTKTRKPRRH